MKISKRILGVALAVIMIFNVFAVGTFAAFPTDSAVKLAIRTDKEVYAPGDIITFTFSEQVIDEVGDMTIAGQYEIGYNDAVLAPKTTSYTLNDHGFIAIADGYDAGISGIQMPADSSGASLYDWNTTICPVVCSTGAAFDATEMTDLFTFQMVVKADAADGTYTVGYNPTGYEEMNAYSADALYGGLYGTVGADNGLSTENTYEFGTCTFKVSSAPAVEVTHDGTQARYAYPGTPSAAAYQFGFLGGVSGLAPETTEQDGRQVVTNIQSIVATAQYNGATVTSEVITMWADGENYGFRAVFAGFDYLDTKDIVVTFAITMADGTTTYTTAEAATDTANGIYTAAVGRGMPAITA